MFCQLTGCFVCVKLFYYKKQVYILLTQNRKGNKMPKTQIDLYFFVGRHCLRHLCVGTTDRDHVRPEHDFYELLYEIHQQAVEDIKGYSLIGLCLPYDVPKTDLKTVNERINGVWDLIWFDGSNLIDMKFLYRKILLKDIVQKGLRQAIVDALETKEK